MIRVVLAVAALAAGASTSFAQSPAQRGEIYADVTTYRQWIASTIGGTLPT